jgi:hypothetical protein
MIKKTKMNYKLTKILTEKRPNFEVLINPELLDKIGFIHVTDNGANYYYLRKTKESNFRISKIDDHFYCSLGDDENGVLFNKIKYFHELQIIVYAIENEYISLNTEILYCNLKDLDISVRLYNSLKYNKIEKLSDLSGYDCSEILKKFRNFGKRSLNELNELLEVNNLNILTDKFNLTCR